MLVIKNARIFTAESDKIIAGDIVIKDGKIVEVGSSVALTAGTYSVIDATGLFAMPGIIDSHNHLGQFFPNPDAQEGNEITSPITAQQSIMDSAIYSDPGFENYLAHGITASCIVPGSVNPIGGIGGVFKNKINGSLEASCVRYPAILKGAMNVGMYSSKGLHPATKAGQVNIIRDAFYMAREYMEKKEQAEKNGIEPPEYNEGMENIARVLTHQIPLKVHVYQHEMLNVIRLAEELDIDFTIDHALGASDFLDDIIHAKGLKGVIYGPMGSLIRLPGMLGKTLDISALITLEENGVVCSVMTDGPMVSANSMLYQGGELIRQGGTLAMALRMLTINAAKILGVDDRIGSLKPGKDADIVLFEGTPCLDVVTRVRMTIIDGEVVYRAD